MGNRCSARGRWRTRRDGARRSPGAVWGCLRVHGPSSNPRPRPLGQRWQPRRCQTMSRVSTRRGVRVRRRPPPRARSMRAAARAAEAAARPLGARTRSTRTGWLTPALGGVRGGAAQPRRPPPSTEAGSRRVVEGEPLATPDADNGWTVRATTVGAEVCTDTELLQAYHAQPTTVEPGLHWLKNPGS